MPSIRNIVIKKTVSIAQLLSLVLVYIVICTNVASNFVCVLNSQVMTHPSIIGNGKDKK